MRSSLLSILVLFTALSAPAAVVVFPDQGLDAAIRSAIGKPSGDILDTDLIGTGFTSLTAENAGITDLTGLEYCMDLRNLNLSWNEIDNIDTLAALTHLNGLYLSGNDIAGIHALANLTNLINLSLSSNRISDIGVLSNLSQVSYLSLYENAIDDIGPLAGLTYLSNLSLYSNQIADIGPLAGLTLMRTLNLGQNQIADIAALAGLTGLRTLNLGGNQVVDIGALATLIELSDLSLYDNRISNITALAGLTGLRWLDLYDNQIADISALSGLTNLMELGLGWNSIVDISALTGLTNLSDLSLFDNHVSDIGPLSGLSNLRWLNVGSNQIADISALSGLTELLELSLHNNFVENVGALAGLVNLVRLNLHNNQISNIDALSNMIDLVYAGLSGNRISDIGALIANAGLNNGDTVSLDNNLLRPDVLQNDIPLLEARGVRVIAAPAAPTELIGEGGAGEVYLRWAANGESDLAGYNVYRDSVQLNNAPLTSPWYSDTSISTGSLYEYYVTAVDNGTYESPASEAITIVAGELEVWIPSQAAYPDAPETMEARVPVNIANAWGIVPNGFNTQFSYDTAMVQSARVERSIITRNVSFLANTDTPGAISVVYTGGAQELRGEGTLFHIYLSMRPDVTGPLCGDMAIPLCRFYDNTGDLLPVHIGPAKSLCLGAGNVLGDLNGDKYVDSGDALKALRLAVRLDDPGEYQNETGDMNGDHIVDSADAVLMQRQGAGYPLSYSDAAKEKWGETALPLAEIVQTDSAISVEIPSVPAHPGDNIQVPVNMSSTAGLCGVNLVLSFPDQLSLTAISAGSLTGDFQIRFNNMESGNARISLSSPQPLGSGAGDLLKLTFAVAGNLSRNAELPIRFNDIRLKGQYGDDFGWYTKVVCVDGSITVSAECGAVTCVVADSETGQPISNASITVYPGDFLATAGNNQGQYVFSCLPESSYLFHITAPGYQAYSESRTISSDASLNITFALVADEQEGEEGEGEGEGSPEPPWSCFCGTTSFSKDTPRGAIAELFVLAVTSLYMLRLCGKRRIFASS